MSELTKAKGSCLCGAVEFHVDQVSASVGACHCSMCRKWGGGPLMAVDCGTDVSFKGKESIAIFDSSEWAERGFCKQCGSHLFYRLKGNNQTMIPVGLMDGDFPFVFDHQVFIDDKPSYYCFANDTENMTGEEVFAKYSPVAE